MLLVIEGIDGAGKGTQAGLLEQKANEAGLRVQRLSFPRYGKTRFAETTADYLNGKFGTIDQVPPQFSALLFAGDRFESRPLLTRLMEENDLVILDRYVTSNIAYHAARVDEAERDTFIEWLAGIEYETYQLPKPDLTLFLDVPVSISKDLVARKDARSYTDAKADIHEARGDYLTICRQVYQRLCERNFGCRWELIPCTDDTGALYTTDHISTRISEQVLATFSHKS